VKAAKNELLKFLKNRLRIPNFIRVLACGKEASMNTDP
jgi:hypothetical protein